MASLHYIRKNAPTLALLLIFLGGWLAVQVSFAMPEPITCGMICCEESGECCCFLSRQEHQHEESDADEGASFQAFQKRCPSNCATQPAANNHTFYQQHSFLFRIKLAPLLDLPARQILHPMQWDFIGQSAPRAPPIFS